MINNDQYPVIQNPDKILWHVSVDSAHNGPVTRKFFSFDDVIMREENVYQNVSVYQIDIKGSWEELY